jgi:hypothetical protein
LFAQSYAQTITTSAIAGAPFCAGASVNVAYTKTGTFNPGNVFCYDCVFFFFCHNFLFFNLIKYMLINCGS